MKWSWVSQLNNWTGLNSTNKLGFGVIWTTRIVKYYFSVKYHFEFSNIDKNKIGEVVFNRAFISLPTQKTIFEKISNFVIHKKQPPPL